MTTKSLNDQVLTTDDLAVYLKISKATLYKLAQEGKLPGQKVGRHWRFHKQTVDFWLSDKKTSAFRNNH